jgi:hypothetical protein
VKNGLIHGRLTSAIHVRIGVLQFSTVNPGTARRISPRCWCRANNASREMFLDLLGASFPIRHFEVFLIAACRVPRGALLRCELKRLKRVVPPNPGLDGFRTIGPIFFSETKAWGVRNRYRQLGPVREINWFIDFNAPVSDSGSYCRHVCLLKYRHCGFWFVDSCPFYQTLCLDQIPEKPSELLLDSFFCTLQAYCLRNARFSRVSLDLLSGQLCRKFSLSNCLYERVTHRHMDCSSEPGRSLGKVPVGIQAT